MTLTAGVVGCGSIARFHFAGLAKAGARIKWVCDLSRETAQPWADQFNARYTADYRELVQDPEVDVVDVTAISSVHKPVCLAGIQAGKAVICEKTLAENAEDALAIVRAAEAQGTIFYTSYMKRFIPAVAQAKELMPSLGRILATHIRAYQCWGDLWDAMPSAGMAYTPPGGKSLIRQKYGGGILVCGGSHILDLVNFFLGRPRRVYGTMVQPPERDYDLQAAALLETDSGIVHFEALAHPLRHIGFLRDGWDERIEINGINGRLEIYSSAWDNVDAKSSLLIHYDNRTGHATEYRYDPVSPFERALAFFCRNIEGGSQGAQSRLTGYDVDQLIACIQESARRHQALDVPWQI